MPQTVNIDNLPDQNAQLPLGIYKVWVREVKQDPSSGGNVMDTFDCEILSPDKVPVGDEEIACAGRTFDIRQVYNNKTLKRAKENLGKLGLSIPRNVDVPSETEIKSGAYKRIPEIQDLTLELKRKSFQIGLKSEPYYKTDTGNWKGKDIIDPETGEKTIAGYKIVADLSEVKSIAKEDDEIPGF